MGKKFKSLTNNELTKKVNLLQKQQNRDNQKFEKKFSDVDASVTNVDYNGALSQAILNIPIGTGHSSRIGREIFVTSVELHVFIESGSQVTTQQPLRLMLFVDKKNTISTIQDVLLIDGGTFSAISFIAPFNRSNRNEWVNKYDRYFCLDSARATSFAFNKTIKINKKVIYDVNNVITQNNIRLLMISDASPASQGLVKPNVKCIVRVNFVDG